MQRPGGTPASLKSQPPIKRRGDSFWGVGVFLEVKRPVFRVWGGFGELTQGSKHKRFVLSGRGDPFWGVGVSRSGGTLTLVLSLKGEEDWSGVAAFDREGGVIRFVGVVFFWGDSQASFPCVGWMRGAHSVGKTHGIRFGQCGV